MYRRLFSHRCIMFSLCAASLWIVTLNNGTVMNGDGSSIVKSPVTGSRLFPSSISTSLDHRSAPTASPSVFVTTPSSAPYTFTLTEGDATLNCKNRDVSPFIVLFLRYDRIDNHFLPQHIRGDLHKTLPVYHVIHFDNMQEGVGKVLSEWRGNLVQRYGLEALLKRYIHPTNATQKLMEYYTPQLWRQVYELYVTDFLLFGWEASPPVSLKDSG